ncbi:MAG: hypothetical protein US76_04345 [Parcubacteria group bacterium GW2011_GWA2_38_13b]|nr:MAG: hypothetical protein US76_04345 [Parcubacteria group bacterium GW2011_GWA2_38_13b]
MFIFNFFIKSAEAVSGVGALGMVPTIGVLYCLFLKALYWFFSFSLIIAIVYAISVGISILTSGGNADTKKTSLNKLYFVAIGVMVILAARIIVERVIPKFLGLGELNIESGSLSSGILDWLFGINLCELLGV